MSTSEKEINDKISWANMLESFGEIFTLKECRNLLAGYMMEKIKLESELKIVNARIKLYRELIEKKEKVSKSK